MDIIISNNNSRPIYEQITTQIKAHIMSGKLSPGQALPSIRGLARDTHVSVITIQNAYDQLQRDGFIETTIGRGSFVSSQNKDFLQEEQQRQLEAHLIEATHIARTYGIPLEKVLALATFFYEGDE